MHDQANHIVTRLNEIDAGGLKLDEKMKALLFLSKVPGSYSSMVSALLATTGIDSMTVEGVQSKLLAEESLR